MLPHDEKFNRFTVNTATDRFVNTNITSVKRFINWRKYNRFATAPNMPRITNKCSTSTFTHRNNRVTDMCFPKKKHD